MANIAYILLCQKDPDAVIKQAEQLTAVSDYMSIHFDASASTAQFRSLQRALKDTPSVTFARKRIRCGWGGWSLVQATLHALESAVEKFPRATHFYMLSGDCMAIKSAEYTHRFLDDNDADFIESFDFFESDWIKTGKKEERLIYRHYFNERSQKKRFYAAFNVQRKLGPVRAIPDDIQVQIGSQWWCLRRQTIEWILEFSKRRRDVMRFFRTTWIPDETFFQTLVRHLVPEKEIQSRTLTFLMFTDYGMPVTFYNDHYDLLLGQDYLFARKISADAADLRRRLGLLYAAERVLERLRQATNVPAIEYLFNEEGALLPDLGGIQKTLEKRTRHRRALMRMLFDYFETDRLIVCMDPGNIELLNDFASDRSVIRMLEIECPFSDDYLIGHAMRVGLAGAQTSHETLERLLPTIRNDTIFESDRIRDAQFENHDQMRESAGEDDNARALSHFLSITSEKAHDIAKTNHLYSD